jgi:hypothetical protein
VISFTAVMHLRTPLATAYLPSLLFPVDWDPEVGNLALASCAQLGKGSVLRAYPIQIPHCNQSQHRRGSISACIQVVWSWNMRKVGVYVHVATIQDIQKSDLK